MNNIVSSSSKKQETLSNTSVHSHDFRSLWNYFFDFGNMDAGNIEPKIDITDKKQSVMVVAEIPGINEEDIDLRISDDGYLTISGEKQNVTEENTKNNYFKEISYGAFKRTIPLPLDLDYEKADANYENGVLTLNIPKSQIEKNKYKKISVNKKNKDNANTIDNNKMQAWLTNFYIYKKLRKQNGAFNYIILVLFQT